MNFDKKRKKSAKDVGESMSANRQQKILEPEPDPPMAASPIQPHFRQTIERVDELSPSP